MCDVGVIIVTNPGQVEVDQGQEWPTLPRVVL